VSSPRAGLAIAVAAILVQAPRLVLALLAADRLPVAPGAERALLVIAGIGTALVLTGGNLYLAHTVAQVRAWRRTLAAAWIAVLVASGGLALPLIVAGLSGSSVSQVLGAGGLEWPWAVLASVAHELTAAGCVLASAAWVASSAGAMGGAGSAASGAAQGAGVVPAGVVPAEAAGEVPARVPAEALPAGMPAGAVPAGVVPAGGLRVRAGTGGDSAPGTSVSNPGTDSVPCRGGCGRTFISRQAEIAHQRHCTSRQSRLGALHLPAGGG
jgi:hypothetical protein